MTDPKRLIEADDVGADLLASARMDGPSRKARTRAAAMLGVGVGIAAATAGGTASASAGASAGAGASATAAKVGGAGLLTKIIGGTLIVAAVGGGTAVAVHESQTPAVQTTVVAPQPTVIPSPKTVTTAASTTTAEPTSEPVVEATATPIESLPTAKVAPRPIATTAAPPQESALTREIRSLDAAKALLEAHNPNGALAALDRHDREFSNGSLRAESSMVRVEALLAKGDDAGAKARARDLLAKDPNGPHAKRLRSILDR